MSWDTIRDSIIKNSCGACDKACLIGADGAVWTSSKGFPKALLISADEAKKIASNLRKNNCEDFQFNGVIVEGVKYNFLRQDEDAVYAKKKGQGCLTLQQTPRLSIVIGHTAEGQQHGDTNKAVAQICRYLESNGY